MWEVMVEFLGDDGENFVPSQISEEDVDNIALSQFCEEMEDNMSLPQIAMKIEKDYADDALCQGGDRNVGNFTIPLQFESFVSKESFDDTNLVAENAFWTLKLKDSLSKGLGTKVLRADPVSDDDAEKLWANGVLPNY
ncbi:Hypothetical predicted protein [Mytilus galloprovincialis]|uniref:Uncharacterized protein n=1 Tax=Mytilus galloprovincialis TaxID=29158 RepID=A0A8B6G0N1_MYTGA|nr:Hypothetical predicted protein [Mytilus galloprovincialis]